MPTKPIRQRYVDQVKLGADGSGSISFTMKADFLLTQTIWRVTPPTLPPGTIPKQTTAVNTINGDDWEGTYSGNQDQSGSMHMMIASDVFTCVWTGGDPNGTAQLTLRGYEYPSGTGMDLYTAGSGSGPPVAGSAGPSNPILGGGGTLIRDAIKSSNFLTGVSGWQITRDGNAEFNNAILRGILETDGANGAYVRIVNIVDPSTNIPESVIIFRPANTTGLVPNWLPDADIGTGMIRAYGDSAAGALGTGVLVSEIDGVAWATGVGAPAGYAIIRLRTPTFDGVTLPRPTIDLNDYNSAGNVDISLSGNVAIGAAGKTVSIPVAKFGRENALINFPNTLTALTGVTLNLVPDVAVYNNYGMWSAGTPGRITLTRNGEHEVGLTVRFVAQAVTAGLRLGIIQQNGVTIADKADPTTTQQNGFVTTVHVTTRFQGAIGDQITFAAFQNSGANLGIVTVSRAWVELIEST